MPTATSLSQYNLYNWGALTTTFTPPPSCTVPVNMQIAPAASPEMIEFAAECSESQQWSCTPLGSAISKAVATAQTGNPAAGFEIDYYSPGFFCPAGWQTVGVAAKSASDSVSRSGVFLAPHAATTSASDSVAEELGPLFPPPPDVLVAALDPSETAVLCCPSSFTPVQTGGWCYSEVASYRPTAGCVRFIPMSDLDDVSTTLDLFGETTPAIIVTFTATSPITETSTTSFAPTESADWVGITVANMITLVHRAADTSGANAPGQTGSSSSGAAALRGRRGPRSGLTDASGANFAFLVALVAMVVGSMFVLAL